MKKANYYQAKEEALRVLKENAIIEPPILSYQLCETYGIKIELVKFDDNRISGMMKFETNTIYVNSEESPKRINFTIAHELGHHFLHRDLYLNNQDKYEVFYRKPIDSDENTCMESEANTFAANLLVPRKVLDKYHEIASVESLSNLFAVSEDVIRFRLKFEYGY
ncbi:MAG: ImmA/IrrE family metallo-endopeptidase [Alphaproteobacteria bacterium]|nr:ImmA/IrrE family metallo-endopeptidase [Alphaproteobacteria bacterium]